MLKKFVGWGAFVLGLGLVACWFVNADSKLHLFSPYVACVISFIYGVLIMAVVLDSEKKYGKKPNKDVDKVNIEGVA